VRKGLLLLAAFAVVVLTAVVYLGLRADSAAQADDPEAKAVLRNAAGSRVGHIKFAQDGDLTKVKVVIDAPLTSLSAGFHGFHVHAVGSCVADPNQPETTWFTSAGGHFKDADPAHAYHGSHNGDLPVLLVSDNGEGRGTAEARFTTDSFTVADIAGRALIVHKLPDNYRNIPLGGGATQYQPVTDDVNNSATATGLTAATGNAGPRHACGVILGDD